MAAVVGALAAAITLGAVPAVDREADWAGFGRYEADNKALTHAPKVVFMGNSITDVWATMRPGFFTDHGFVGRGISGQTSSQMLVRFQEDVIELKPKAVVILAGTNDIAQNNGTISVERIFKNIKSMCQLAKANGIRPFIASVLPAYAYSWNKSVAPAEEIAKLNRLLKDYAVGAGITYIDYYTPMVDDRGGLRADLSKDGVHPTAAGYGVMEPIALKALKKYVK